MTRRLVAAYGAVGVTLATLMALLAAGPGVWLAWFLAWPALLGGTVIVLHRGGSRQPTAQDSASSGRPEQPAAEVLIPGPRGRLPDARRVVVVHDGLSRRPNE